jgi:mannose-6-phosphate isomerase-like protein (cupin superfamily)
MDKNIVSPALKKQYICMAAITVIVPLLLLSSIEFSDYNNDLSLLKYALAQKDGSNNDNVGNTMSNISDQPSSLANATATATITNATPRDNTTPFVVDIISLAKQNNNFRQEINTANLTQVVLMSLKPGEDIGMEIHKYIDQILVFVQGNGEANINGQKSPIKEGDLAFIPAGTPHDFTNTGSTDLKLYTTYSPPNHYPGTLQKTKADTKGYEPMGEEIEIENEYETENE